MDRIEMKRVIGGKRYDTETATLIADNVYWDGHNFERNGRNTWLYRTPRGAYFQVTGSRWEGERDTLEPLSRDDAIALYEDLDDDEAMDFEAAFNIAPEEPEPDRGRPPMYGEPMRQTAVWLPENMIAWLQAQPGSQSETMRALIEAAMQSQE
jgi:hypothetical protein